MRSLGFDADLRACLALRDARARENAAARERAMANPELRAALLDAARRRGQAEIDWPDYFRNIDVNYP